VDSNSAANTRLIAQNQHLIAEIARLTADNDALKSQVSTSESNKHKAESTNAVLEAQVANMTATHQTDLEEIDRLQKEVAQWKGHVDKMRARLDELFKVSMA
jgi:chromosome segregation ATPase